MGIQRKAKVRTRTARSGAGAATAAEISAFRPVHSCSSVAVTADSTTRRIAYCCASGNVASTRHIDASISLCEGRWSGCPCRLARIARYAKSNHSSTTAGDCWTSCAYVAAATCWVRVYVRGWNAAMDDARRVVAAASPLECSDIPVTAPPLAAYGHRANQPLGRKDPAAARAARSGLESLFVDASGDADA